MANHDDTQEQLNDLEEEEARIMRELRDLEERARADEEAKQRNERALRDEPENALATLLSECEKEVRDAKGYIADHGPPLNIVRVRVGETAPKGATFLSRPKSTGVDFTVPLTTKEYASVIKRPMFLNTIRDKIKARMYTSSDDYVDDMRLMARNTATFNKGPELAWVVQHARLLLEAAEDAVTARRKQFYVAEDAIRQASTNKNRSAAGGSSTTGKRKRTSQGGSAMDTANGETKMPSVGQAIEVYWPNYRRWFTASVVGKSGSNVHVIYEEDNTDQWIDLQSNMRWRVRNTRAAASTKSRRSQEPSSVKRRKGTTSSAGPLDNGTGAAHVPPALASEDIDAVRNELLAKLEEFKLNVENLIKDHMDRIDRMLLRSDHLDRVLLAVEDSRENVELFMERIEKRQSRLENDLERLTPQDLKTPRKDSGDRSASENIPSPVRKSVEEATEPDNLEGKVSDKVPVPKQTQAEEVVGVVFVPHGKSDQAQLEEKGTGLFDLGHEKERDGVNQDNEGDDKNGVSAEEDTEVTFANDKSVKKDAGTADVPSRLQEVKSPLNTSENKEIISVEGDHPMATAAGTGKGETHGYQSDVKDESDEPKVLRVLVDKANAESQNEDDGKSRGQPREEGEQDNGTIETAAEAKREREKEGLRSAMIIDSDSSEDSDESEDSHGSDNDSNPDDDGLKKQRNSADNIGEGDSEKLMPELKTTEDQNSSGKGGNTDNASSDKEALESNEGSDNEENEMTKVAVKGKEAGSMVSNGADCDNSEDDKEKDTAKRLCG